MSVDNKSKKRQGVDSQECRSDEIPGFAAAAVVVAAVADVFAVVVENR